MRNIEAYEVARFVFVLGNATTTTQRYLHPVQIMMQFGCFIIDTVALTVSATGIQNKLIIY